jgi:hypothetical protein
MSDQTEHDKPAQALANICSVRLDGSVCPPALRAEETGRRILENEELVNMILDAGRGLGPPMTVAEFKAWLDRLGDERDPSHV